MNIMKGVQLTRCLPLALVAAFGFSSLAQANHPGAPSGTENVQPEFVPGNPTCAGLFPGSYEFKINDPGSGMYTGGNHPDGTMTVSITTYSTGAGNVFDWSTSNALVHDLVVKGGPNANLYGYGDGVNADTVLHSPVNHNNGKYYGLSHISFCYEPVLADPDLTVDKDCPDAPVLINGGLGGATYNYDVTVTNSGENTDDALLTNFVVTEALDDMAGISCAITTAPYAVDINGATVIPNLSLAEGEWAQFNVACTADAPLDGQPNFIEITADTGFAHEPTVSDNDTAVCPENAPPPISITKECGDPMIRLVPVDDKLVVEACVTIKVKNEGFAGDETLVDVKLFDDLVFGAGNHEALPNLAPQQYTMDTYCYFPSAPTGPTLGDEGVWYSIFTVLEQEGDLAEALFTNTAVVTANGAFSGVATTPAEDSAHCSICVSDNPDLPAECPDPSDNPYPLFNND